MTFLPSLEVMLAYTAAGIVLVITPGPDMTLFLRSRPRVGPARVGTLVLNGHSKQVREPERGSVRSGRIMARKASRAGYLCFPG